MTIKGRRFRRTTGRSVSPKRKTGGKRLLQMNTAISPPRQAPSYRAQLNTFQAGLRPIRTKKSGNLNSGFSSTHDMLVTEQAPGVYGYVRA